MLMNIRYLFHRFQIHHLFLRILESGNCSRIDGAHGFIDLIGLEVLLHHISRGIFDLYWGWAFGRRSEGKDFFTHQFFWNIGF
jgi:hypothetical protein